GARSGPAPTTAGSRQKPSAQLVQQWLKLLRSYRWSSYPMPVTPKRPAGCAAGRCSPMAAAGPRTAPGITAAMSNKPSAKGMSNGPEKGLVGQAVLGSRNFIEELTKRVRGIRAEASAGAISVAARRFRRRLETDRRLRALQK